MGVLTTGNTFSTGDQVTASKLNDAVNSATLQAAAVDNTSTQLSSGAIIVKDLGITQDKIAADAVGTNELANDVVVNTSGSITGAAGSFTTLAASGVVSVPDGSESVPSITNTGDTNTGIYFPDENSVALTAGAGATLTSTNTAITIDVPTSIVSTAQSDLTLQGGDANSKNLIFKKASAQQGKISAVGDELKFYAGTSATETLELTTTEAVVTGNLGIGTAAPSNTLHVENLTSSGAYINYDGQSNTEFGLRIESNANGGDFESDFVYGGTALLDLYANSSSISGGDFLVARTQSATPVFLVKGNGNVGIGATTPAHKLQISEASTDFAALITNSTSSGNGLKINAGDNVGDRILELNDKDGNAKFVVKSTAAVGIGTASPAEELHISASVPKIQIQDSDGTDQYGQFYHSAGVTGIQARNNTSDGTIVFQKYDGTTTDETMRISSAGNVGIGDNDPSKELVVKNISTAGTESVINVISGNTGVAGLYLGDSDDDIVAGIVYDNSADTLQLRSSNNQTAVTIDSSERVGIGATTPAAPLEVASTTGGVIVPRMTTTQRNAISSPTNGEMVYDTTDNKFYGCVIGSWVAFH